MGDFFMVLKDMGLVSTTLSVAKLTHIFFISNFEEDQGEGWDDWEWEMSWPEFREAIVRIAVLSVHPKAEDLDHLFSTVRAYVHTHACVHACMHARMSAYMHVSAHVCVHARTCTCVGPCMHASACACVCGGFADSCVCMCDVSASSFVKPSDHCQRLATCQACLTLRLACVTLFVLAGFVG